MRTVKLAHGGDSLKNPILSQIYFTVTLHKQQDQDTFKAAWIRANNKIYTILTDRCTETSSTIYVTIHNGVDTYVTDDKVPRLNFVYITTTNGMYKYGFYAMAQPDTKITLDGYDARNINEPIIYQFQRNPRSS